jgi:heterotetrameric sarcosine oxidase gamma subunit
MNDSRTSPLRALVAAAPAPVRELLNHPDELVKRGVKGPGVAAWTQRHDLPLPATRYAVLPVGAAGVLARAGEGELVLECTPQDALWERWQAALAESPAGVYDIPQQSVTLELSGPRASRVLSRSCAVNLAEEPVETILYTRIAGVSCAVLPRGAGEPRSYRLWVDYSLAAYLWTTLAELTEDL